ncbi:MAG: hypothetical protein HY516_04055 [Candidatus Aenigmarchaeota archaeon]|nr:hypothetical protein [Candidatus Aenigmarchaeota archaeon]
MITLVGTVHEDLAGPERLKRVLTHYHPQTVAVEISSDTRLEKDMLGRNRVLEQTYLPRIVSVYSGVDPVMGQVIQEVVEGLIRIRGYELKEARSYAKRTGSSVVYLGDPVKRKARHSIDVSQFESFMKQLLAVGEQLAADEDIVKAFKDIPSAQLREQMTVGMKQTLDNFYQSRGINPDEDEELMMEDHLWAEKLGKINPNLSVMPVVGCLHTRNYRGKKYSTLYTLLEGLNPSVILLPEADGLTA